MRVSAGLQRAFGGVTLRWKGIVAAALVTVSLVAHAGLAQSGRASSPAEVFRAVVGQEALAQDGATAPVVRVRGLGLAAGLAALRFNDALLFPLETKLPGVLEVAFVGSARLTLTPVDDIEREQIRLFTGKPALDAELSEGVLVVTLDAAIDSLLDRPPAQDVDVAKRERGEALGREWRESTERALRYVDAGLVSDAVGDAGADGFFVAWVESVEHGRLLYSVDPAAVEPVTLERFVPLDLSRRQTKKIRRAIHKEQRAGRLLGTSVEQLGAWDTWTSSPLYREGRPVHGSGGFEPLHYSIDARLVGRKLDLEATTTVRVETRSSRRRVLRFVMPDDLVVSSVEGQGTDLVFFQSDGQLVVVLDEPPEVGTAFEVAIHFAGVALSKTDHVSPEVYYLTNTLNWYPHLGETDLATYDVRFRWPERWQVLIGGDVVDEGRDGKERWVETRVTKPTKGITFEIGDFEIVESSVGSTRVRLAVDALTRRWVDRPEVVLGYVEGPLAFMAEKFGPYPLDELLVVTSPARAFSQASLGLITLSSLMLNDSELFAALQFEDPRTVIAHEVAHQWWGHQVSWSGYRDQWLSEALANFSASLYQRERLSTDVWPRPTDGWQAALTDLTASGTWVDSAGPVVLGVRLESSQTDAAFQPIVYQKGSLVIDALWQRMGADTFTQILRWLLENRSFQPTSTRQFLSYLEQGSGLDLGPFSRRYVYGTGIPSMVYSTHVVPSEDGFRLLVDVERRSSVRYAYRILPHDSGLDVRREVVKIPMSHDFDLVVPIRIWFGGEPEEATERASRGARSGNGRETETPEFGSVRAGDVQVLLQAGERSEFEVALPEHPSNVELDPDQATLAFFAARDATTKIEKLRQGRQLAAEGPALARVRYEEGLELVGDEEWADRYYDVELTLELLRLDLDAGGLERAKETLKASRSRLRKVPQLLRGYLPKEIDIAEARLDLLQGDARGAFKKLSRLEREWGASDDPEALLLRLAAAMVLGERESVVELEEKIRPLHAIALGVGVDEDFFERVFP